MNRKLHTRNARARHADTWADGVMQLHDEAAGVMRMHTVAPHQAGDLLTAALMGNAEAARLARVVIDTLRQIETAPPDAPMECGCCAQPLRGGLLICVAFADREEPGCGLAFALCRHCTKDATACTANAAEALRTIWPDVRLVEITHPAGGAA